MICKQTCILISRLHCSKIFPGYLLFKRHTTTRRRLGLTEEDFHNKFLGLRVVDVILFTGSEVRK